MNEVGFYKKVVSRLRLRIAKTREAGVRDALKIRLENALRSLAEAEASKARFEAELNRALAQRGAQ